MLSFALALILIGAFFILPRCVPKWLEQEMGIAWRLRVACALGAIIALVTCSIVAVPEEQVGIVKKKYGIQNLPKGRIVATDGETGYQAVVIPPGTWRLAPLFNAFNTVETRPLVIVPSGYYGRVVARDGRSLPEGQIIADAWPENETTQFLDAEYFLTRNGQKGVQLNVLKPGAYPVNLALFEVRIGKQTADKSGVAGEDIYGIDGFRHENTSTIDTSITRVSAGSVGVVRSSVSQPGKDCKPITARANPDGLTAELVQQGCKGVWRESLPPNDYFLNRDAYDVTIISTRVATIDLRGGYERRYIDVKLDDKGAFALFERTAKITEIGDDRAVTAKVENWEIQQEVRALVQISPENAPIVVAAVGSQKDVNDRIVIPAIRAHMRDVFGGKITVNDVDDNGKPVTVTRQTKVVDTIEQREVLSAAILKQTREDGRHAGIDITEIKLGDTVFPPELLLSHQREQLAKQMETALVQEQQTQNQRKLTEQARATADQQNVLVTAQIGAQSADLLQERRKAEGHAERLFLEEQAAGETAQVSVLGKDNVMRLQALSRITELLTLHPELVSNLKLPHTFVTGAGGGIDAAAAIFGGLMPAPAQKADPESPAK